MTSLVDTYTVKTGDSAKVLSINGYEVAVHISTVANNAITVQNDGLHVNISGKADKVTSATENNLAAFDANGNLKDSQAARPSRTRRYSSLLKESTLQSILSAIQTRDSRLESILNKLKSCPSAITLYIG